MKINIISIVFCSIFLSCSTKYERTIRTFDYIGNAVMTPNGETVVMLLRDAIFDEFGDNRVDRKVRIFLTSFSIEGRIVAEQFLGKISSEGDHSWEIISVSDSSCLLRNDELYCIMNIFTGKYVKKERSEYYVLDECDLNNFVCVSGSTYAVFNMQNSEGTGYISKLYRVDFGRSAVETIAEYNGHFNFVRGKLNDPNIFLVGNLLDNVIGCINLSTLEISSLCKYNGASDHKKEYAFGDSSFIGLNSTYPCDSILFCPEMIFTGTITNQSRCNFSQYFSVSHDFYHDMPSTDINGTHILLQSTNNVVLIPNFRTGNQEHITLFTSRLDTFHYVNEAIL